MSEAIHPLPQYAFMAWCSVKAQGDIKNNEDGLTSIRTKFNENRSTCSKVIDVKVQR
jgi:hypothetical protein